MIATWYFLLKFLFHLAVFLIATVSCLTGSLTQGQGQHSAEQADELRKRKEKMEAHLAREVEEMHQFRQVSS